MPEAFGSHSEVLLLSVAEVYLTMVLSCVLIILQILIFAIAQNLLSSAPERRRSSSAVGAYRDQGAVLWHKTGSGSRLRGLDTVFRCAPDLLDRRSISGHIASFGVLNNY
jgi:hypothetical protein